MEKLATAIGLESTSQIEKRTLISVLVPLYNEKNSIGECLKRVLNAPLPAETDLEIVIVDDGSTDGSLQELLMRSHYIPG
jgi:glycosyltransferase involved in cell wall biosynthesis